MDINLVSEAKRYIKPYRKEIKCSRKHKKMLLNLMVSSGKEYIRQHPNANLNDLHDYWSSPAEIIQNFRDTIGHDEIRKSYKRSKWITIGVCAAIVVILLVGMYFGFRYMQSLQKPPIFIENPTVVYR